jgi:Tfp pilus assembly protein PilO
MTDFNRIFAEKRSLVWPLALVLIANAVVYALVVYPLSQKVAMGEQEATAANFALVTARREHANARATVTGKGQADAELKKFYSDVLPPDLSGARRITYLPLEHLAEESNLRLERQALSPDERNEGGLAKLTTTATLTGEYRDIRRFLHQLETRPEFIVLENVDLTQNESEMSRGITVTVQVATYFRTGGDGN